jgi:NDP-sugar pyrophosphorylase family protein
MLLCAGLGTRLRPLTDERPKPLVPVLGRPLASYAMSRLAEIGVKHIVANTHHLGDLVHPALAPFAQKLNQALDTVHEPVLLGTGGGIRNALPKLGREPFVVFNGDVLAAPSLGAALDLHARLGARMTMILRDDPRASALGAIEIDEASQRVVRILGEGDAPKSPVRRCMFTGIYVLTPDVEPELPENGCIVRHTLRRLLARGDTVAGIVDEGPWHDLGTIESYASVNLGLLDGSIAYPNVEPPFEARMVDPLARVEPGVKLGRCITVGPRAMLGGEGLIERAIVWDGAAVRMPFTDAILTSRGTRVAIPSSPLP